MAVCFTAILQAGRKEMSFTGWSCHTSVSFNFTSFRENPGTEVLVIHAMPVICWYACLKTFCLEVYVSFVHGVDIVLVVSEWGSVVELRINTKSSGGKLPVSTVAASNCSCTVHACI